MNLEAKDLRIGNYIAEYECEPYFFAIEQITKYVGSELWVVYRNGSIKVKEPTPIPLTEQWLIDFGFKQREDCEGWFLNGIVYYNGLLSETQKYSIQYVHQLQNLFFALTNEELTLK